MVQSSGPIAQGTASERQFTDVLWRDLFGDEAGVVGDLDGTSYALALPSSSDIVSVGSASQVSTAKVAGFVHRIPAASPEDIFIPPASGSARTDIIALRYDPGFTGLPGPVRLTRIAGTTSALPAYDAAPPGVEDLPLWGVTRQPSQTLSQATVTRLFPRLAPSLHLPAGAPLPLSSPLGTEVRLGTATYRRVMGTSGSPTWVPSYTQYGTIALLDNSAVPAGVGILHLRTTLKATISNGTGGFNVDFGFSYTKLISVGLQAGDNNGGLAYVTPIVANHTLSSANGQARRADGSAVPSGTIIRVEVDAVGYIQ